MVRDYIRIGVARGLFSRTLKSAGAQRCALRCSFAAADSVGKIAVALTLVAIAVAALGPLGNIMLSPLEQRFPQALYPARGATD
jgi:hypothetical protein